MFRDRLDYIRKIFAPETPEQLAARCSILADNDRISIHPEEGKMLQFLIRLGNAKKIVEIGALAGYSALWMADALPEDGRIITIEKDKNRAELARKNIVHNPKIRLVENDAVQALEDIATQGPFDMVFIDADKLHYLHYLDWTEKNVRKGGIIVADNTFLFDAVWKDEPVERVRETARNTLREFNRRLADPEKYCGVMLPTAEGMTVGIKMF